MALQALTVRVCEKAETRDPQKAFVIKVGWTISSSVSLLFQRKQDGILRKISLPNLKVMDSLRNSAFLRMFCGWL